jgi:hypothetical protein
MVSYNTRDGNASNTVMGNENTLWTEIILTRDGNASNTVMATKIL